MTHIDMSKSKPTTSLLKLIKGGMIIYTDSWETARIRRGTIFGGLVAERQRLKGGSFLKTKRYPLNLDGLEKAMAYVFDPNSEDRVAEREALKRGQDKIIEKAFGNVNINA